MNDPEVEDFIAKALAEAGQPQPKSQPARAPSPQPLPEAASAAPPETAPAGPGFLEGLLQLRLASILTSRYVDLKLGDFWGTAILVFQAPLIGFLIGLAFDGAREDKSLDFVLAMISVWFGVFNACREVVKERLIFLRERRAGVPIRAYLVSKLLVLAFLGAVQCLLLVVLVDRAVRFDAALPAVFLALFVTTLSATALGLFLSSIVKSQNALLALVPIVLIPQLIFSDLLIPNPALVVERIELVMAADWSLAMLLELNKSEPSWLELAQSAGALLGMGLAQLLLAGISLRLQEDE